MGRDEREINRFVYHHHHPSWGKRTMNRLVLGYYFKLVCSLNILINLSLLISIEKMTN